MLSMNSAGLLKLMSHSGFCRTNEMRLIATEVLGDCYVVLSRDYNEEMYPPPMKVLICD